MHFGMFAFMESICCHGKLEDSNTKLEFAMQRQRKRTWLPDSAFAHVPVKVPISGVSTVIRFAWHLLHVYFFFALQKVCTQAAPILRMVHRIYSRW